MKHSSLPPARRRRLKGCNSSLYHSFLLPNDGNGPLGNPPSLLLFGVRGPFPALSVHIREFRATSKDKNFKIEPLHYGKVSIGYVAFRISNFVSFGRKCHFHTDALALLAFTCAYLHAQTVPKISHFEIVRYLKIVHTVQNISR